MTRIFWHACGEVANIPGMAEWTWAWWTWKHTYAVCVFLLLASAGLYYGLSLAASLSQAVAASVLWGGLTLLLCLTFMLGAASTPRQFLVFFGSGAFGAGMGYLVGAWLTPGGDSNPLDQVRNIVAGVLSGVVGTKLLSLWDDLVDKPAGGGAPPILTSNYFIPIVLWLVGFTISLSAFYTVRTSQSGDVRVTYYPRTDVRVLGAKPTSPGGKALDLPYLGILPDTVVQFTGAANSPVDVRVDWSFHLAKPCEAPIGTATFDKTKFDKEMTGAFDSLTGKLQTPPLTALDSWINSCPGSQDWRLVATSIQDRSKSSGYQVKFCRSQEDCPLAAAAGPGEAKPSASSGQSGKHDGAQPAPQAQPPAGTNKPVNQAKP